VSRSRRDIDEIDDLDVLETYGWSEDPWDSSNGVGEVEQLRSQTRVARWVGFAAIALVTVLIIGAGFYGMWYIRQANPPGDAGALVQFQVADGETLRTVSERLEDDGIVTSAGFFRSYAGDHGGLDTIEPGLYLLRPGDHVGNILARLRTSPSEAITRVTFPEGFTLEQMANRLEADENLPQFSADAFMAAASDPTIVSLFRRAGTTSLEGLLFPATYEVSNADSERQVIERMVQNMEYVGEQLDISAPDPSLGPFTPYQILTVASIIEKEAKTDTDRALISRVIYNRLAANMPLQIDATLLYDIDPSTGVDPNDLQSGDIDLLRTIAGPYNSFTNTGLPPTPIANPGRASIDAALHPAGNPSAGSAVCSGIPEDQCRYYYYVLSDEQGNHSFWVTGEQFTAAVQAAADAGLLDVLGD
jgi:UPF0755 protein